jgi:hypothetical protein
MFSLRASLFNSVFHVTAGSLKEFGRLLNTIEDERDRMVSEVPELSDRV